MITIKSKNQNFGINFPTSKHEITPQFLTTITEQVKLSKHYCAVALCFETRLFEFVAMLKSQATKNISVTPLVAKIGEEDAKLINVSVGDRLLIDRSSLERGIHFTIPTVISSTAARRYFDSDPELVKDILNRRKVAKDDGRLSDDYNTNIVVLEFKIVPINDIVASLPLLANIVDPFVIYDEGVN